MICKDFVKVLEEVAPCKYAYLWDNVGLLVGDYEKKIQRVLIALDVTEELIERAVRENIDMIVTHHPLIFEGMKQVTRHDFVQRRVYQLIQHDICYYAMHTNYDVMRMGKVVAKQLELQDSNVLEVTVQDMTTIEGCGRYGNLLKSITLEAYAKEVRKQLQVNQVLVYGSFSTMIQKVAVMPGSGADAIQKAIELKVDVLVTGDMKHHQGMDAVAQGLAIIDAGHYGTEKFFITDMKEYLLQHIKGVEIQVFEQGEPFQVV
ncbi:MAG: Nif3-like dinuclear metal center hexameric protein [Eubacteriales bacterium]